MKRTKYRWKPKRKKSALQIWMSSIQACRLTLLSARRTASARQMRMVRHTFRRDEPDAHKEKKVLARTQRMLARKLNSARVSWARKIWEGRSGAGGKSTNDRHFPGELVYSPQLKPFKPLVRKLKGNTRTPSPKGLR